MSRPGSQWALQGFAARLTASQVSALRHDPAVARVVPDATVTVGADSWPPGIRRVHGSSGETSAKPDVDMDVAVIDTGIGPVGGPVGDTAELNIAGGKDCRPGGNGDTSDGHGHGTHVAGTIGARDNGVGVVGVAPGVRLWPVRVFDSSGRGTTQSVICGIDWVARWMHDHRGRPMVANMSLRGYDDYRRLHGAVTRMAATSTIPEHDAICAATAARVPCSWSRPATSTTTRTTTSRRATTRSSRSPPSPTSTGSPAASRSSRPSAAARRRRAPSGTTRSRATATSAPPWTSSLPAPVSAPWRRAPATTVRTAVMSGTSMATPHVTGAVALYLAAHPDADPDRVRRQVIASGIARLGDGHRPRPARRIRDGRCCASWTRRPSPRTMRRPSTSGRAHAVVTIGRGVQHVSVPFELQREGGLGGAVDLAVGRAAARVSAWSTRAPSGVSRGCAVRSTWTCRRWRRPATTHLS